MTRTTRPGRPPPPRSPAVGDDYRAALIAFKQGDLRRAEAVCLPHMRANNSDPRYWHLGSLVAHKVGQRDLAVGRIAQALALDGENAEILGHAAEIFRAAGKLDEAVGYGERAAKKQPRNATILNNLGLVYRKLERTEDARRCFEKACAAKPDYARARYNLGLLDEDAGDHDKAVVHYDKALSLDPRYARAHAGRGNCFLAGREYEQAEAEYRQALALDPNNTVALHSYAVLLDRRGRTEEAFPLLDRLCKVDPQSDHAFTTLGNMLTTDFQLVAAQKAFRRALELKPDNDMARVNLVMANTDLADWRGYAEDVAAMRKASTQPTEEGKEPLASASMAVRLPFSPAEQLAIANTHARHTLEAAAKLDIPKFEYAARGDKLRIGYVSADFRRHAVAHAMMGVFRRHDRSTFEIHAYSTCKDDGSEHRQRIKDECDHFTDIRELDTEDAAKRIHADGIDILVDLTGYTRNGRPELLAARPAPVTVNFLGYPGSMGEGLADYVIVDPSIATPGDDSAFSEKVVRLPHTYMPTDNELAISEAPPRESIGLPADGFVFCAYNRPYKFEPAGFDTWMNILRRVPDSVLWMLADGRDRDTVIANLRRETETRGVDPSRLVFSSYCEHKSDHLGRLTHAGLFLDTFIYGAHTSGVDALWAGVPTLTCRGDSFASRVGAGLLRSIGLTELIVEDKKDYEEMAVDLATHPDKLAAIKQKLADNRLTTPLFDTDLWVKNLEAAFLEIAKDAGLR